MKQTQEAEIINISEVREAKASGSGGGFDHFSTMVPGTVFAVAVNGKRSSKLKEYMLCSKAGVTVLLQGVKGKLQRHIGNKFWTLHTLVQILHIPDKKEQENGKGADV